MMDTMKNLNIEGRIKQLEAENKKHIETKTVLTKQAMYLTEKNQRLKADFKTVEKLRDEAISDLYKEQSENQRLTEAIEDIIEEYRDFLLPQTWKRRLLRQLQKVLEE